MSSPLSVLGRVWSVSPSRILAGLTALLCLTALLPPTKARATLLLCLSALAPLIALRPAWNVATLLFAGPVASLSLWFLGTWLGWSCGLDGALAWWPASLAAILTLAARAKPRPLRLRFEDQDVWALAFALAVCVPVGLVFAASGLQADGSYTLRHWWGRDSLYFASLVQMALERHAYPVENPFVAGSANLYPSAAHLAFAGLSEQANTVAVHAIKPLAFVVLVASSGLVLLTTAKHLSRPASPRVSGLRFLVPLLSALCWMGIRPDLFVFPQTQSMVYGAFVLALLLHEDRSTWGNRFVVASLCIYLALAHAVTCATCAAWLAACGIHALMQRRIRSAALQLGLAALLAVIFLVLNRTLYPSSRIPFSWSNVGWAATHARPWALPAVAVLIAVVAGARGRLPVLAPLFPLILGLAYHRFGVTLADPSHAWFVAFNAERFPHYALLLAFLLLPLLSRAVRLTALTLVVASIVVQPPQLLLSSQYLLTMAPDRLTATDLRFFEGVRTTTPPQARILSLAPTLALPAFTGRAQAAIESHDAWSMNALPEGEVARRQSEHASFPDLPPAERERIVDVGGYTHLLIRSPDGRAAEPYVQNLLPAHRPQLIHREDDLFLFALRRP